MLAPNHTLMTLRAIILCLHVLPFRTRIAHPFPMFLPRSKERVVDVATADPSATASVTLVVSSVLRPSCGRWDN